MYKIKNKFIASGTFGHVHKLKVIQNSPGHSETIHSETIHVEAMKFFTNQDYLKTAINEIVILRQLCGLPNIVQIKHFCHADIKKAELNSSFLNKLSSNENPVTDNSIRPHVIRNLFVTGPVMVITMGYYQADLLSLRKLIPLAHYEQYAQTNIDFLAAGLARGLYHLRRHKIVHGDIKINNILVNYTMTDGYKDVVLTDVRICDFNISLMLPQSQVLESILCVNRQMSPKVWRAPELSFDILQSQKNKIDIWNYGCLLYEFMTSRFLFPQGFKKAYWSYFSRGVNVVYEEEISDQRPEKKIKLVSSQALKIDNLSYDLDAILVNVPREASEHFSVTTTQKIQIYQSSRNKILFKEENAKILDICLGCFEINPMWRITPEDILKKLNICVADNVEPIIPNTISLPEYQLTNEDKNTIFEVKKLIAGYISCHRPTEVKIFVHFECILDRYVCLGSAKQIDRNLALACLFVAHSLDFSRLINELLNLECKSDNFARIYEIVCDILDSGCDLQLRLCEMRVLKYINYVCTERIKAQTDKKEIKFVDMFVDIATNSKF